MFNILKRIFMWPDGDKTTSLPSSQEYKYCTDFTFAPSCACPQPYIIIDVETTGLSPEDDQIIQLSALRFTKEGQPDGSFNTYLNPGRKIPSRATQINGITDRMVAKAPTAKQAKESFIAFSSDHLIVGYNITFDLKFLCNTFGDEFRHRNYIDVLSLAREYLNLSNYKLKTVSTSIGFYPKGGFHNSLSDCEATAAVLCHLSQIAESMESWVCYFHGGLTEEEKKKRKESELWYALSQALYLQGEAARKEGRFEDALCLFDQAKEASGVVYPFLFESYAKIYRKQRDFQSEIRILDEGIARLGKDHCPSLVERREKAIQKLKATEITELKSEEKAQKRAERAARKQEKLEAAKSKPVQQTCRPILKLDDVGTILEEFPSVSAAERASGIDSKGIRNAANGKQKHAGGFCWKYK